MQHEHILTKFIYIWLFFSLIFFTFIIPPFQKPDEINHFLRATALVKGEFFCKEHFGNGYFLTPYNFYNLPNQMSANVLKYQYNEKFPLHAISAEQSRDNHLIKVTGLCMLPPIGYLSNAIGISIGLLANNPLLAFYLGRIFAGIFFLICIIIALKTIPQKYKLVIYVYASIPMVVHQATAISYDSMQLSLFILIFSLWVKLLSLEKINKRQLALFLFLLGLFTLAKSGYYAILLLFFAIPYKKITNNFSHYLYSIVFVCIPLIILTVLSAGTIFTPLPGNKLVNPTLQMNYLLQNPFALLHVLFNSLQSYGDFYYQSLFAYFGWIDFHTSYFMYEGYTILIALSIYFLIRHNTAPLINKTQLSLLFIVIIATILLIFISQYLSWSPVAATVIHGIQGRYFLVLIPLTIFSIVQAALLLGKRNFCVVLGVGFITFLILDIVFNTYNRYYNYKNIYLNEYPFTKIMETLNKSQTGTKLILLDKPYIFIIDNKQKDKTIDGFSIVFNTNTTTSETSYEYSIKDAFCNKTLRQGLLNIYASHNKQKYTVYEEEFTSPVEKGNIKLCIRIAPLSKTKTAGYTHLVLINNKPLFEPLYNR
ncbi:MAG TPA: DUF2142 domain-containing protein [Candidatus Saccharimonadales bacterium]|nr:DUF2142 domain-containing protein [Candidatus Saccharimonadales bacterium]